MGAFLLFKVNPSLPGSRILARILFNKIQFTKYRQNFTTWFEIARDYWLLKMYTFLKTLQPFL